MNTSTFVKRINFAYTKQGTLNKRFIRAVENIKMMAQGKHFRPFRWLRSKRHCNLKGANDMQYTELLCKNLGIELLRGNDAPRGGFEGEFMYMSKKDIAKLKDVDFDLI